MRSRWLSIRALSPVIATASSGTVGSPRSLPFLPGSMLLGAVAGRIYRSPELRALGDSHLQTGLIRFGDALPVLDEGAEPVPLPLAFHHPKGKPEVNEWRNHVVHSVSDQAVQLRGGVLDGAGERPLIRARFESSDHTALQDGLARDGFLYSLHALCAGQRFLSRIDFEEGAEDGFVDRVHSLLDGELRLGRSRGAEFGRAVGEWVEAPAAVPTASRAMEGGVVPILALSDWCLRDPDTGCPSFRLQPGMLGMAPGAFTVLPDQSFLRTRQYSPFNAYRRRPDHERHVIERGSVVTVRLGGASLSQLREASRDGVGEHRRDGLGRVLVSPSFLHAPGFQAWRSTERADPSALFEHASLADDPMMRWVEARGAERVAREAALGLAQRWRRGLRADFDALPTKSQWGRVRGLALSAATHGELLQGLGDIIQSADGLQGAWARRERNGPRVLGEVVVAGLRGEPALGLRAMQILAALMVRERDEGGR